MNKENPKSRFIARDFGFLFYFNCPQTFRQTSQTE